MARVKCSTCATKTNDGFVIKYESIIIIVYCLVAVSNRLICNLLQCCAPDANPLHRINLHMNVVIQVLMPLFTQPVYQLVECIFVDRLKSSLRLSTI